MRVKGWSKPPKSTLNYLKISPQKTRHFKKPKHSTLPFHHPTFTHLRRFVIRTTSVYQLSPSYLHHSHTRKRRRWLFAAVDFNSETDTVFDNYKPQLLHPLTLKPLHYSLPDNFDIYSLRLFDRRLRSFLHTPFNLDKIVVRHRHIPRYLSWDYYTVPCNNTLLGLFGGGHLIGRPYLINEDEEQEQHTPWGHISDHKFDDVVHDANEKRTYVVDRFGRLYVVNNTVKSRVLKLGRTVIADPVTSDSGGLGWRKRFVERWKELYLVVRAEEVVFRVYKFQRESLSECWVEVKWFGGRSVLFLSKDCYFFVDEFGGGEYEKCIVFTEGAFPKYGSDGGWDYSSGEDEIGVFRMSDDKYGRVGETDEFPEIDWSPPSWVFNSGSSSSSQSEGEPDDEDDGGSQSDSKDSNSEHEDEEQEVMELDSDSQDQEQEERSNSDVHDDSNSHETKDEEMHSNATINGDASSQEHVLPPSVFASASAVEEEVTRTLLQMNSGIEATEKDTSRTNIALSALRPCTSSTNKSCQNDSATTTKFEEFEVRADLIPTLQKIWRKHGNIVENSTMRSGDIIARALESLATIVQILDNNSIESLSDCQADYLSSTLSDLKVMCFKVEWLSSFVEKAVKLHKSKPLVESLNKLSQLSSQVKECRAILLDEVAKLTEEENKLKKEMVKVTKLIPFAGQVKFGELLGSGLT